MRYKSCKGFTLVELLVVIGIIVILASLAVVGVQSATRSAKMTDAQTTIIDMYTAIELYKNENGKYPDEQSNYYVSTGSGNVLDDLGDLFAYDKEFLISGNLCDPWKQQILYDLKGVDDNGNANTTHDAISGIMPSEATSHIAKILTYGYYNKSDKDPKLFIYKKQK